jgi:DNA-binding protein YbaB
MGVLNAAKMLRKAQQAKSSMKAISVAGRSKSGLTALLLNGLHEIIEMEFADEMFQDLNKEKLEREVMQAYNDAKQQLEKQLASNMDMDSLREMLAS